MGNELQTEPEKPLMPLTALESFMAKLPFVMWDRYTQGPGEVNAFGWISREDGRADFVLLQLYDDWDLPNFWTSSAKYSEEIATLLYGSAEGHCPCQRVEHAGLALPNVIRLDKVS